MDGIQEFDAVVEQAGSKVFVRVPFDADALWGKKDRHHVTGTVGEARFRGPLIREEGRYLVSLGAAWRRDKGVMPGERVRVALWPEGPQRNALARDFAAALAKEPAARTFFDSLATFYRKNYVRWIDEAKRPETRAARIAETVELLKAGRKQR